MKGSVLCTFVIPAVALLVVSGCNAEGDTATVKQAVVATVTKTVAAETSPAPLSPPSASSRAERPSPTAKRSKTTHVPPQPPTHRQSRTVTPQATSRKPTPPALPPAAPAAPRRTTSAPAAATSNCAIKGNISSKGEKIYHVPGQRYYNATKITTSKGERWFCSESDAVAAGWRKSKV